MIDTLTFEMIKRIVSNVGAEPESIGKLGLVSSDLLLHKTISIKYDNGREADHNVYAGKLSLDQSTLKGLLVDLTINNSPEFIFVFRFDSLPIHVIRIAYDHPDESFIRVYNEEKKTWIIPSVYINAKILADFERFVSWGLLWGECKEIGDLYDVAVMSID